MDLFVYTLSCCLQCLCYGKLVNYFVIWLVRTQLEHARQKKPIICKSSQTLSGRHFYADDILKIKIAHVSWSEAVTWNQTRLWAALSTTGYDVCGALAAHAWYLATNDTPLIKGRAPTTQDGGNKEQLSPLVNIFRLITLVIWQEIKETKYLIGCT